MTRKPRWLHWQYQTRCLAGQVILMIERDASQRRTYSAGRHLARLLVRQHGRAAERAVIRARQRHTAAQPDRPRIAAMHHAYRRRA